MSLVAPQFETLLSQSVKNIEKYYQVAKDQNLPDYKWYENANKFAQELSEKYNVPVFVVCGIISCFSRNAGWGENKRLTECFLAGKAKGLPSAIAQARKIATAKSENQVLDYFTKWKIRFFKDENGDKKIARLMNEGRSDTMKLAVFYRNLLNPNSANTLTMQISARFVETFPSVTVDRHAAAIALNIPFDEKVASSKYTGRKYSVIAKAYEIVANRVGLLPHELQATTWVVYRNMKGISKQYDN